MSRVTLRKLYKLHVAVTLALHSYTVTSYPPSWTEELLDDHSRELGARLVNDRSIIKLIVR